MTTAAERFNAMGELVHNLTAALRHATQLEVKQGHNISSLDTEAMLSEDMRNASIALATYHNLVRKKETTNG